MSGAVEMTEYHENFDKTISWTIVSERVFILRFFNFNLYFILFANDLLLSSVWIFHIRLWVSNQNTQEATDSDIVGIMLNKNSTKPPEKSKK